MESTKSYRLLWCVFFLFVANIWVCTEATIYSQQSVLMNWTTYRHAARTKNPPPRDEELNSFLMSKHRGVYKDHDRNKQLGLTNTVVLIIQLVQKQTDNFTPRMALLNNMICHLERHGIMSVLYLSRYLFNRTIPVENHFVPNDHMLYVPFPDLSFWDMLISVGQTSSPFSKQRAKFPYPNFKEYGDKAVMFCVLELLKADLNVILLDDDVMLFRDPVPFLINKHITADIVTPEDSRQCVLLGNPLFDVSKWKTLQPEINLGVTFFRSRAQVILLVRRWMNLIQYNGQKAFFPFRRVMDTDNSCHTRRREVEPPTRNKSSEDSRRMSICYLSNTLFQNGYVNSFRCGKYNMNPLYSLVLAEEVLTHKNHFSPGHSLAKNVSLSMVTSAMELEKLSRGESDLHLLSPVTIHPNYEAKELTIINYKFWVYDIVKEGGDTEKKTCRSFSLSQQEEQFNSSYAPLENAIQKRIAEVRLFLAKYRSSEATRGLILSSFFYATEAMPKPSVVFRLRGDMVFEVFDVIPNSFRILQGRNGSADIRFVDPSSPSATVTVAVLPFSIFGDKHFSLVATLPVLDYSYFW